ncbi:NAD(P)-dependent oxidoreductase [Actinospica robiniae]|uniref:NAD(P)-dependent oxidoreductase n=1 Tax=Actinospica robiniae TaxID=304901 RepID=UPI0003F6C977|nr:NAD(P)-dependent oxidoreductase [Actinospica robiniae]
MAAFEIGLLHPGAMGARVAEQAAANGAIVWWLPEGRSAQSRARAAEAGLRDAGSLKQLAERCQIILSVCPPANALEVARSVAALDFAGIYADLNAISPANAASIATLFADPSSVVDGGIVGGPPHRPGETRLYLSGPGAAAERVRALFEATALEPHVLAGDVGRASALKLAFASFNKISYVLAVQAYALASGHGVLDELLELAEHAVPGTALARPDQVAGAGPRAWRWAPEMHEIAEACDAVGAPAAIARAAADVFEHWHALKGADSVSVRRLLDELGVNSADDPDNML